MASPSGADTGTEEGTGCHLLCFPYSDSAPGALPTGPAAAGRNRGTMARREAGTAPEGRTGRTWCCRRCRRCCRCRGPRVRGGCGRGPLSPLLAPHLQADVTAIAPDDWLSGLIGSHRPRAAAPPLGAGAPHWWERARQGPAHRCSSGAVPAGPTRRMPLALGARGPIPLPSPPSLIPHTGILSPKSESSVVPSLIAFLHPSHWHPQSEGSVLLSLSAFPHPSHRHLRTSD